MIGTSVSVAKYMKAPVNEAKKFERSEFPPTAHSIQRFGTTPAIVSPSCVEPSRNPAVTTPMASRGMICLAKPHDDKAHSRFSASCLSQSSMTERAVIPTIIGTSRTSLASAMNAIASHAESSVAAAAAATHVSFSFSTRTSDQQSSSPNSAVKYHL